MQHNTILKAVFFPASHCPLKSSVSPLQRRHAPALHRACTCSAPDLRLACARPSPRRSPRASRSAALSSGCHRRRSRTAMDPLRPYPPTARPFPPVNTAATGPRPQCIAVPCSGVPRATRRSDKRLLPPWGSLETAAHGVRGGLPGLLAHGLGAQDPPRGRR